MAAQDILLARYGDPFDFSFQRTFMELWQVKNDFHWFPNQRLFIHKDFKTVLNTAFRALERNELHHEIISCEGVFNQRTVRGSVLTLSLHAWGCAIDLNAHSNPLGSEGNWSDDFLQTMRDCDVFCGKDFKRRKDPMHFALLNG
jgi:D-alanyl-D-alanine carboxypeptidase